MRASVLDLFCVLAVCATAGALRTRADPRGSKNLPVSSEAVLLNDSLATQMRTDARPANIDNSNETGENDWDLEVSSVRNCGGLVPNRFGWNWTDVCKNGSLWCNATRLGDTWVEEWVRMPPQDQPLGPPKLAILLLAYDRVHFVRTWVQWLEEADAAGLSYRMIIHIKDQKKPLTQSKGLEQYVLNFSSPTGRCHNTPAEWTLLEQALLDPDVTHMATFSGDSIPVRPLASVYQELARDSATRMCMDWDYGLPRAEMWWIMRRVDAALFVAHRDNATSVFELGCDDEGQWMLALALRSWYWGMEKAPLQNACVMFTDWTDSCKAWADHGHVSHFKNLREESHTNATPGSPRTYFSIGPKSLEELRNSSFWWARKFWNVSSEQLQTTE